MKRIFEQHKDDFPGYNTYVTISWFDLPDDVDFSKYNTRAMNVVYPDCHLSVLDEKRNGFYIRLPKPIQHILFCGHQQSLNAAITLLQKLEYEQGLLHAGEKIPYDNTVA